MSFYTAFLNSGMRATREDERDDEDDDKKGQCAFVCECVIVCVQKHNFVFWSWLHLEMRGCRIGVKEVGEGAVFGFSR